MEQFKRTQAMIVEGGFLKKPWPCPVVTYQDRSFMVLAKKDRDLARAIGLDTLSRAPCKDVTAYNYLQHLRNRKVDELITNKLADPMADPAIERVRLCKDRPKMFVAAELPQIVDVTVPAFVTSDGKRIEATTIPVITTPSKVPSVAIECTPRTLEWLAHACEINWQSVDPSLFHEAQSPAKRSAKAVAEEMQLPELANPFKYMISPGGKLGIYVTCRKEDGRWARRQKKIEDLLSDNAEANATIVENVCKGLQTYRAQHHHGQSGEEEEVDEAAA